MKKGVKLILFFCLGILIVLSIISASWFGDLKNKITGEATQSVGLNVSIGGPQIITVYNDTIPTLSSLASGPTENTFTDVVINFTVYSTSGSGNLNKSTAFANITGDATRQNASCYNTESSGNYANYTCRIVMWWWDGTGTWTINTYIEDNQTNSVTNASTDFYVGERTAFVMGPGTLEWPGISPGGTNQTSNNDALLLNNTGNDVIDVSSISINASNLRGETTPSEALWANNFSVDWQTGGTCSGAACLECAGTVMNRGIYQTVTTSNLTKGNYTLNDGYTGQEELYFCLRLAGSELSSQAYSTSNETEWPWVLQIV
jgi:hypothetical protein